MNLEELRQSYRPATVQVLLVGESPPASGAFFYSGDSELYRSTRDAFAAVFPEFRNAESFLEQFSHLGCFLDDLSHEPVNQYTGHDSASRRMRLRLRRDGETRLATTIAKLKPKVIIVLLIRFLRPYAASYSVSRGPLDDSAVRGSLPSGHPAQLTTG